MGLAIDVGINDTCIEGGDYTVHVSWNMQYAVDGDYFIFYSDGVDSMIDNLEVYNSKEFPPSTSITPTEGNGGLPMELLLVGGGAVVVLIVVIVVWKNKS
jgi:hypothetical protein